MGKYVCFLGGKTEYMVFLFNLPHLLQLGQQHYGATVVIRIIGMRALRSVMRGWFRGNCKYMHVDDMADLIKKF